MALRNQKHFTNKPLSFHRQIKKKPPTNKQNHRQTQKTNRQKIKKSPRNQTKKGSRKVIFEV